MPKSDENPQGKGPWKSLTEKKETNFTSYL